MRQKYATFNERSPMKPLYLQLYIDRRLTLNMCFKLDRFIQEFMLSIDVEEVNLIKLNNTLANFDLQRTRKTVS